MTQSIQPNENVYVSITFGNIPREKANAIVEEIEHMAQGYDMSLDWGSPIGDQPTPVFEETADAVGSAPVTQAPATSTADEAVQDATNG